MPRPERPPLEPGEVTVRPATPERFDDVARLVGPTRPGDRACWCLAPRGDAGRRDREQHLRDLVEAGPPPGLLASVDDVPAGWIGLGPRSAMPRLARSRTIPSLDDLPVWSVVCFRVAAAYRRRGMSALLLAAAIELAREHGAPALEGYPIDPAGERRDATFSFVGFTHVFEDAGFVRVRRTDATSARLPRWLMRLDLRTDAPEGAR